VDHKGHIEDGFAFLSSIPETLDGLKVRIIADPIPFDDGGFHFLEVRCAKDSIKNDSKCIIGVEPSAARCS
jgi:hypothetical protein